VTALQDRSIPSNPTKTEASYSTNSANALIHLYRAEVGKLTAYRSRLDITTNWAVVTTAGLTSFAFSNSDASHVVLVGAMVVNYFFLHTEARRFRIYEISHHRVRIMERFFYPAMLGEQVDGSWHNVILGELAKPHSPLTRWESVGWRLRRNYFWIYIGILVAWVIKFDSDRAPGVNYTFMEHLELARVGNIEGWVVTLAVAVFYLFLLQLTLKAGRAYKLDGD